MVFPPEKAKQATGPTVQQELAAAGSSTLEKVTLGLIKFWERVQESSTLPKHSMMGREWDSGRDREGEAEEQ